MSEENTQTQGAIPLIYGKIAEVMSKIGAVTKDRKTTGYASFSFRGIDDVMNTLHGVLASAGVFIVPNVIHEDRSERTGAKGNTLFYTRLTVRFTFYASDGSSISSTVIGEAMDSGDKASNKALSIAYKYACLQVFCIPTEDDKDPDAITHEVRPNNNAYNVPRSAVQASPQNNRVNYQAQPQQYSQQYAQPQQVPQDAQARNAANVFANMQRAADIPQPSAQRAPSAPGVNQGVIF